MRPPYVREEGPILMIYGESCSAVIYVARISARHSFRISSAHIFLAELEVARSNNAYENAGEND